jgi:7,8-dihydroneopterin aldolase/epimerase/oxygenase
MDKLLINGLDIWARIGVTAAEREVGQWLVATIEVGFDLSPAGRSDDLNDTLSYADIAQTIHEVGSTTTCNLLEYMAEQMVEAVLSGFPGAAWVRLQLVKRPPPVGLTMQSAGVEIYRER